MTTTLTRPERSAAYNAAVDRVAAVSREMVAEVKARKPDPRSIHDYRSYLTMGLVCVLVVKHRDREASIECSINGNSSVHIFLPTKLCIVQPDGVGEFLLICVPKWLAQRAGLAGVTRDLTDARAWTKTDLEAWETLRKIRLGVNSKIYNANRRTSSNISKVNAA